MMNSIVLNRVTAISRSFYHGSDMYKNIFIKPFDPINIIKSTSESLVALEALGIPIYFSSYISISTIRVAYTLRLFFQYIFSTKNLPKDDLKLLQIISNSIEGIHTRISNILKNYATDSESYEKLLFEFRDFYYSVELNKIVTPEQIVLCNEFLDYIQSEQGSINKDIATAFLKPIETNFCSKVLQGILQEKNIQTVTAKCQRLVINTCWEEEHSQHLMSLSQVSIEKKTPNYIYKNQIKNLCELQSKNSNSSEIAEKSVHCISEYHKKFKEIRRERLSILEVVEVVLFIENIAKFLFPSMGLIIIYKISMILNKIISNYYKYYLENLAITGKSF